MAVKWKNGHANSILCLSVSSDGLVASGAEAGELTIWSDRGVPQDKLKFDSGADVTCVAFSPTCPSRLYTSHGETVSVLDVRSLKEPVVRFRVSEDEINCISVNDDESLLSAADDSGTITVIDLEGKKVIRALRKHSNICSAVAFRPGRPQGMVSCGLDMQVMLWNLNKTRPQFLLNLQHLTEEEEEEEEVGQQLDGGKLFNPPLAHSLSVANCGNIFACGSEDGRIRVFRVTGPKFELEVGFRGHSKGVSQAQFLNFLPAPWCLLTGGNDGKVLLWDMSCAIAKDHPNALRYGHNRKIRRSPLSKKEDKARAEGGSAEQHFHMSPKLCVEHGEKVNWITGAEIKGSKLVLVADQSSSVSVYPLTFS